MTLAAGVSSSVFYLSGQDYLSVVGDTWPIRQQLARMGFKWDAVNKQWIQPLAAVLKNRSTISGLQSLGVNVPQAQQQMGFGPQNWATRSGIVWYLARRKSDNAPIILSKVPNGWDWRTQDGNKGTFPEVGIANIAQSERGPDGKPISSTNPDELFRQIAPELELEKQPESGIKGRIPPDKISQHQKQVEETFLNTNKNVMMSALAGTGKTTMLRHLASFKDPNQKWLYLVFNKKNQLEGKAKFPPDVEVLTSHAFLGRVLGNSADMNLIPRTDLWTKGERISQILDHNLEYDDTFPMQVKYAAKKVIKQLTSLAKAYAINPSDAGAPAKLQDIVRQYQIDCDLSTDKFTSNRDWTKELIDKTLDIMHVSLPGKSGVPEYENFRDHDDTLWYSAIISDGVKWPKYDVVLADEVQDFNRCQMIMLNKLAEAGARIVAVGDENQSLYLFRGADAHAFQNIEKMLGGLKTGSAVHNLPVNYRSGRAIIKYVNENTKVKNLQAGLQHEGLVTEDTMYDDAVANLSKEWKSNRGKLAQPTAFIGRTNRPLVTCALDLMKNDMDFVILGRDFSKELVDHIEKVLGKGRRQETVAIQGLTNRLNDYVSQLGIKWVGKISKQGELKQIKDTTEALIEVIQFLDMNNYRDPRLNMTVKNSVDFMEYLRRRFAGVNNDTPDGAAELAKRDARSFVTITTAHRSKGLEFERVFIVRRDLFPHPNAKTPEALEQEQNAFYVCVTRAMDKLHILRHPPARH